MIANADSPGLPVDSSQEFNRCDELKARTREVLSREIGFVPNPGFRELDVDRAWQSELSAELPPAAPSTAKDRHGMPAHLERICSTPLLTPAEERDLFCRMNYLKYRANATRSTLNANRPNAKKLAEVEALLRRAESIRNRIVSANTRLVVSIVRRFADRRNLFDDLLSEGIGCLLKAADKFDFDRGFRFSTYATMAVRREVYRLIQRTHRDRSRYATGASKVLDAQIDENQLSARTETVLTQLNRSTSQMLERLDEREQFIVKARFGFIDLGEKPTFARIGERLGISKERVRQLEIRAMSKLRDLSVEFHMANYVP